jgi:hypothetical protein
MLTPKEHKAWFFGSATNSDDPQNLQPLQSQLVNIRPSELRASPGEALESAMSSPMKLELTASGSAIQLDEGYWGGLKPHWVAMGMLDEYQFHVGLQSVTFGRNSAQCDYTLLYSDISQYEDRR